MKALALTLASLSLCLCLTSCFGGSTGSLGTTYPNATLAVSPTATSINAGASLGFTATVTNDPETPFWTVSSTNDGTINGGTSTVFASNVTYTAPAAPPIFATDLNPAHQGIVTLICTEGTSLLGGINVTETMHVIAASVTAGISPATASVALGATSQFFGYAVGSANNAVSWQVNGISGGSSTVGTITSLGTYTAPTAMPMSGSTVIITLTSVADPTKTATATITLH